MLTTQNLKPGNWIFATDNGQLRPVQLDAALLQTLQTAGTSIGGTHQAIPLTLHLLEKADFHFLRMPEGAMKHGSLERVLIRHSVTEGSDSFSLVNEETNRTYTVNYLHELQNIFADEFNTPLVVRSGF